MQSLIEAQDFVLYLFLDDDIPIFLIDPEIGS